MRVIWNAFYTSLPATSAHGVRRAWPAGRSVVPELSVRKLSARAYDDGFVTALGSNLGLHAATVATLRNERVQELVLRTLNRDELRKEFNISLVDAVLINDWRETVERARLKAEETVERARLKAEETAERARLKQLKFDQAKLVRIFNEDSRNYDDYYFPDQSSLQTFFSNQRTSGLALVDPSSSSSLVVTDWERLVDGSHYTAFLKKKQDAVEVLTSELIKADKSKAEYGCNRLLSDYFHMELHYIASDIKMTDKSGKSLGDIDTLFVSEDRSRVVLLERKSFLSTNATSVSSLIGQIHATKRAFLDPDTLFSEPLLRGETYMANASVVNAVYCKAGPANLFRALTTDGIHVVTSAADHLAPTHL